MGKNRLRVMWISSMWPSDMRGQTGMIIHDFSASARPGQKIAIVGPTGAGKTTLVNLLMRFHEIQERKDPHRRRFHEGYAPGGGSRSVLHGASGYLAL